MYKLNFQKRVWIAKQENTGFRRTLNLLRIEHYLARVNRLQTNGKVERSFLSYRTGYTSGAFASLNAFIKHYNEARLHMSLHYKTPKGVWGECKLVSGL